MSVAIKQIKDWWYLKKARRAARKYNLDLEYLCCFQYQVKSIGQGLKHGNGEIVLVPMQSGKTAKYKVTSERYCVASEYTGQRNWYFEFQGYA